MSSTTVSASLYVCALAAITSLAAHAAEIDPQHTQIGFTLKTRWGQTLLGRFPRYSGSIESLDDGREQVRLKLSSKDVEIVGHPSYTSMTRSRGFFEAERFPEVEFVSDPYPSALVAAGGKLAGQLTIRDVTRRETFTIQPSTCARPAIDCDVIASGSVRRTDYGVDRWVLAVSDNVRFTLRLRMREDNE